MAIACVEELQAEGWHLPDAAVAAGLAEVSLAGAAGSGRPPAAGVLDCAHNVASALALVQTLQIFVSAGASSARLRRQQR